MVQSTQRYTNFVGSALSSPQSSASRKHVWREREFIRSVQETVRWNRGTIQLYEQKVTSKRDSWFHDVSKNLFYWKSKIWGQRWVKAKLLLSCKFGVPELSFNSLWRANDVYCTCPKTLTKFFLRQKRLNWLTFASKNFVGSVQRRVLYMRNAGWSKS